MSSVIEKKRITKWWCLGEYVVQPLVAAALSGPQERLARFSKARGAWPVRESPSAAGAASAARNWAARELRAICRPGSSLAVLLMPKFEILGLFSKVVLISHRSHTH